MYTIDKQFSFCYGHRVWSQQLQKEFCESGDTSCKCRHLHGHEATVHVFLESDQLSRGMVTDFKHLGWLNTFLNQYLDHKFIIDINDPWFVNITGLEPKYTTEGLLTSFVPRRPLNTTDETYLRAKPVYVPNTKFIAGYVVDVFELTGVEREFIESFFIVPFLPTSEHFTSWIYKIVEAKMSSLNVRVSRVEWFETPKSRSAYSENNK